MRLINYLIGLVIWLQIFSLASCSDDQDDNKLFSRIPHHRSGVDFINTNHETERSNILSYEYFYNGGGVALGDINNDGLVDIYFTSNIFSNKLYLNQGDFKFVDITEKSGTACETGWKTGVTMVDINADGLLDIYVCRSASPDPERRRNILLINNGDLTFTDKAKEYNLDDASYSTQAAFFDFDHDDDLDAIILNHSLLEISNVFNITVKNSDVRFPDVGNRFYRNDNGSFVEVSDSVGVFGSAFNYGLGLSLSDVNNDGWIDMYTGSDYTARDRLLINQQGQYFKDVTNEQLSHISKFTMGTDIADVNGDGYMDILTLDMLPEDNYRQKQLMGSDRYDVYNTMVKSGLHSQYMRNMLHLNNGDGTFSEIGQLAGISNTDWSWGALIQDFDNDGISDIVVSNGFKRDLTNNDFAKYKAFQEIEAARSRGEEVNTLEILSKFTENKIPNYIFKGNGDLTFTNVTEAWGFDQPVITNGIAYADLDNDGDLDIVTNNMNEEAGIYQNNSERFGYNFLSIRLKGHHNTFAIGARVAVYAEGNTIFKELSPVRGFQSSVDHNLLFGLGKAQKIDSVVVWWPSGGRTVNKSTSVNKFLIIEESQKSDAIQQPFYSPMFNQVNGIDFTHDENDYNDFNIQPLLPRMYSTEGPALALGDVNRDGLNDVVIGGAKGQGVYLYLQQKYGDYILNKQSSFAVAIEREVVDAVFFDADGDKDLDLYLVTGGYEFQLQDQALEDLLFENDGNGNFSLLPLPSFRQSGSCVRPVDIDQDNDIDLFVGGRIVPGRYPEAPESYILLNDGKGNFAIDTLWGASIRKTGMVTDAAWSDLNADGREDLIVVGEWMPIKMFINTPGQLVDRTHDYFSKPTEGLWNCVLIDDFNNDGNMDIAAGNQGLNSQMRANEKHPVRLYYADYDDNGSIDPILDYLVMNTSYPYPSRDELLEQLPSFKKRFTDYASYADATISKVLTAGELTNSNQLTAYKLESSLFIMINGNFEAKPLPIQFQFAPIFSLISADVNDDGQQDIITGGNLSATRARTGKMTGNTGFVFIGDGTGGFEFVSPVRTGLSFTGDVRQILKDDDVIIVGANDQQVKMYKLNR